jgi:hypothetical protein
MGVRLDGVRPLRLAIPSLGCGEKWTATGEFGQLTEAVLRWAFDIEESLNGIGEYLVVSVLNRGWRSSMCGDA